MYRRASEPGSAYCASVNAAGNDVSCSARWVAMCLLRVSRPSADDRRIEWVVLNATRPEGVVMTEPDDPSDLALQSRVRSWVGCRSPTRCPTGSGSPLCWQRRCRTAIPGLSLIHISEPTRLGMISYAV